MEKPSSVVKLVQVIAKTTKMDLHRIHTDHHDLAALLTPIPFWQIQYQSE
jgi:hypothetical protein